MDINTAFDWKCQPQAEALLLALLQKCLTANKEIHELGQNLLNVTSTRLFDWVDHFIVGSSPRLEKELEAYGFVLLDSSSSTRLFHHPGAQLPRLAIRDDALPAFGVAVSVESIADFLMVRGLTRWIEGEPFSGYRRCAVSTKNEASLWVIERRGVTGLEPTYPNPSQTIDYINSQEKWKSRPRRNNDEDLQFAIDLAVEFVALLGRDLAAWLILECERAYWQTRNTAAQIQKNRQDRLGMGWANHDHHTFRSSRRNFTKLVRLFEVLGFHCRERYWAGKEAGWGAQIMENPQCRLVLFLDVDLEPDEIAIDFAHHSFEIAIDFAHHSLPESKQLGTIGLWCELHGDSILDAGMHHLEAQFMFDNLTQNLAGLGIGMMKPFSNFPYLMQAFTEGEKWRVNTQRINHLLQSNKISKEQAQKFEAEGALGSHMENLQRREGYKGFNQKNVSLIIKETDPRLGHTSP